MYIGNHSKLVHITAVRIRDMVAREGRWMGVFPEDVGYSERGITLFGDDYDGGERLVQVACFRFDNHLYHQTLAMLDCDDPVKEPWKWYHAWPDLNDYTLIDVESKWSSVNLIDPKGTQFNEIVWC